jgi:hypothetical protein
MRRILWRAAFFMTDAEERFRTCCKKSFSGLPSPTIWAAIPGLKLPALLKSGGNPVMAEG